MAPPSPVPSSPVPSSPAPSEPRRPARVGLLKCGSIRADLAADHGDYPELFGALLAPHPLELVTYDVEHGPLPEGPEECDGWLVSGSASSVYEPLPWIDRTRDFLAAVVAAERPLVAVCFGHQLLAQVLGGEVTRSERGWGVGVHHYDVIAPLPGWPAATAPPRRLSLLASHRDQVTQVPPGITILASSHHCPVAAYALGERILSVQAHPEFTRAVTRGLVEGRRELIGPERADAAVLGLDQAIDNDLVATWFAAILAP